MRIEGGFLAPYQFLIFDYLTNQFDPKMIQNKLPSLATLLISFIIGCIVSVAITLPAQELDTLPPPGDTSNQPASTVQDSTAPNTNVANNLGVQGDRGSDDETPDQNVVVVERLAGWNGAGYGINGGRLSEDLRSNWVMVDANGGINCRVSTIGSADLTQFKVYLLNNGRVVTTERVPESGNFRLSNVVQGTYSLVGYGENAFFAFGFNALNNSVTAMNVPRSIEGAAFQNKTTINNDWIRYFAPNVRMRVYGRYTVSEAQNDPASLYGIEGLAAHQPNGIPSTSIKFHQSAKANDGRFVGRVRPINSIHGRPVELQQTKVLLLQEDNVVASAMADSFGVFEMNGVAAGQYGLVAAGADGVGMVGVEIVESGVTQAPPFDFCLVASESIGWLNNFAIEESYRRQLMRPRPGSMQSTCPQCGHQCMPNGCGQCGWGSGYPGNYRKRENHFQKSIRRLNEHVDRLFYPDEYSPRTVPYQDPYNYTRGR